MEASTTTATQPQPRRRRVKLDTDVNRGDPAQLLLGNDEQPARRHAPLPRKRRIVNAATIRLDVELRMDELRPLVNESKILEEALEVLEKIK